MPNPSSSSILRIFFLLSSCLVLSQQQIGLDLNPKDLKLVKGQKLDVNCSLSTSMSSKSRISRSGYKSTQLKFAIKMPKKIDSSDSDQLSTSQSAPDEELFTTVIVPGQNVTIHDGRTANLKYDVEAFQEGNYLLICYLNKMKTADIFSVGTLPYDVINITCNVLNWSDLICTFVTSGVSSEYITKYNVFIKRSYSDKYENQATIDSEVSKTDYKFSIENFVNDGLLDAVDIYFIGTNIFGQTTSRSFNINLKDVNVIKAVRDLKVSSSSPNPSNQQIFKFEFHYPFYYLSHKEDVLIHLKISCARTNLSKDFTEILSPDNKELVAMEIDETLLPAFSQCSSSVRLKPLNYGLFSEWSNSPSFHTSVRVPLKNPDIEESFYSILKCSCTGRQSSCDVSFYFKPLKLDESRGPISEYRMNISTQSSSPSSPSGNTKIFLNINNLHNKLDNLLLSNDCCGCTAYPEQSSGSCGTSLEVTLEAATSAGYNNTIPASLYVIPFKRCHNSFTFDEKVDDVSVHVQFVPRLFDVVRINGTSADIIWSVAGPITQLEQHLSDSVDVGQYFIVWCSYDRFTQCKDDMSWEKVDNAKKVNIYSFSSSEHEVYNYHFGISRAGGEPGGIYWMAEHCFFNAKSPLKDVLITNTDRLVVVEKHPCNKPNENYFRRFHVSILVNNEPVRELENDLESAEIMLNANEMHETTKLIFTFYGWLNGDHGDDDILHGDDNARSIVKRQEFHPYDRLGSTTQVNHDTWVAIVVAACVFFFCALAVVCCRRYWATSHCCAPLKIQVPARDSASLKPSAAEASAATSAASKATSAVAASTSATATGAKRGKFKNILSPPYLYSKSVVVQITNQNEINDDDDADDDDEFDGYENTRVETNGVNEYGVNDEEREDAHQGRHFLDDDDASQSDADYNSAGTGAYAKKSELRVIENEIIIDKDLAKKKAAPVNVDNAEDNYTSNIVNSTDLFVTNQLQISRTVTTTASTSNSNSSNVNVSKLNHEASISTNSPAQTSSRPPNSCTTSISTSLLRSPSFSGPQTKTTPSTLHSLRNEALTLLVAPLQTMKSSPTALTDEFFNSLQTTNSQDDKVDKNVRIVNDVNQSSSSYSSSSSSLSPSRRNSKTGACDDSAGLYSFAGMTMVSEMERRSLPLDDKRISRDENINDIFGDDNTNNFYNNNDNIKNTNTCKNNNVTNEYVEKRRIKFSDDQHFKNGENSRNDVDRKNISPEFCRNFDVNNMHADECQCLMNDDGNMFDEDDGYCLSLAVES